MNKKKEFPVTQLNTPSLDELIKEAIFSPKLYKDLKFYPSRRNTTWKKNISGTNECKTGFHQDVSLLFNHYKYRTGTPRE